MILPLALIIMTSLLLGAFAIGRIVFEGLMRGRNIDASTVAYYAADAGVERQLYVARKQSENISALGSMSATLPNGATYAAVGSGFLTTNSKFFSSIQDGDFQFVDLFNPDQLNMASGIAEVRWTYSGPGGCELEVAYAQWDVTKPSILPEEFKINRSFGGSGFVNIDPNKAYRLRFRPRRCSVTNVSVSAYRFPGDVASIPFPGDITIAAQGNVSSTAQTISVTMPRLEILSGVFSYVIFTECTLFKDPSGSAPACP